MRWAILLLLAACASAPATMCPVHVKAWSGDQQAQALVDLDALSKDSMLIYMLADYASMRSEAHTCLEGADVR